MSSHPLCRTETVESLLTDTEPWLSCDDCFDGTDTVIEALLATATPLDATFRVHFAACPACLEEARSLATLIAADFDLTAKEATERLDDAIARHDT